MRILLTLLTLLTLSVPVSAQEMVVPQSREQVRLSYAPLVKKVAPAVVNIYTRRTVQGRSEFNSFMNDPFFSQFFDNFAPMRERVESSLGSGFIVDSEGLIVTNAHVIEDAQEIMVILSDGREMEAELVLIDKASDLGLLQITDDIPYLPSVELAPSETLEVGDLVIAIGNPFGVGQTVTSGIVSALARSNTNINNFNFFIQTDAAINPGNSGGPLVSMDGKVIGVNSAIYSRSGGSLGIGFAVPSEMVTSVIAAQNTGQTSPRGVVRAWLGFTAQSLTSDIASSLGLDRPHGALVSDVFQSGPADKAGLQRNDVIITINDRDIRDAEELKFRIATMSLGEQASLNVLRQGKTKQLIFTASRAPEIPSRDVLTLSNNSIFDGATVINVSPAVIEEMELKNIDDGVVVESVKRGSRASRIGLRAGDGIIAIGDKRIGSTRQLNSFLSKTPGNRRWVITLRRQGRDQTLILR